eukprot:772007-Prymnesium_polylepis.1
MQTSEHMTGGLLTHSHLTQSSRPQAGAAQAQPYGPQSQARAPPAPPSGRVPSPCSSLPRHAGAQPPSPPSPPPGAPASA